MLNKLLFELIQVAIVAKSEQTVTAKTAILLQSAMCNRGNFNEY